MAIVSCPECGKKLKIADTSVGKKVKGPCGHIFVAANGEAPAPAAAKPAPAVTPEKVYVACTECESKLKVATTSLGKKMKCPKCSAVFVANLPEEAPIKKAPPPPEPEEEEAPAPKTKAKPAVSDDDMDDLLNFAAADAETKDEADDDAGDLFKNEPIKSRAKRRMDDEESKAPVEEDEEELPKPKGKKPPRAEEDEEAPKPVYPSRLVPNILVALLLLIFIGLIAAIFLNVNIAKEIGLPEAKGVKPKLPLKSGNNLPQLDPEAARKADLAKFEGTWVVQSAEQNGKPLDQLKGDTYTFANGKVTGPDLNNANFTIDASASPKTIDLHTLPMEWFLGIYEFDGELLKWCIQTSGEIKGGKLGNDNIARRPKAFDPKQGTLYFLKRGKATGKDKINHDGGAKGKTDNKDGKNKVDNENNGQKEVKLDGTWVLKSIAVNGKAIPDNVGEPVVIRDGMIEGIGPPTKITIDGSTSPKSIEFAMDEKTKAPGIFQFVGDNLQIALAQGATRPKDFSGANSVLMTLRPAAKGESLYSRTGSEINLKVIGLAIHGYHDANKGLPQISIGDQGKPLLSWRVALLPYLDEGELYRQFDLTKPWDHPTNKKLIAKMPRYFAVPMLKGQEGMTHYRAFDGPGTPMDSSKKSTLLSISDGTTNTILVVEAAEPTIWTKPDDLKFDPKGPLPRFGVIPGGFQVVMADATPRFVKLPVKDEVIRPYLTGNNGMPRMPLGEIRGLNPDKLPPPKDKVPEREIDPKEKPKKITNFPKDSFKYKDSFPNDFFKDKNSKDLKSEPKESKQSRLLRPFRAEEWTMASAHLSVARPRFYERLQ
ncbi:MAG TPA: TIGR03067 domain-containing protein [Gemmataceae bacterium]|nr:TIGR03067 domain-containing protein [Gemmataceae bacterium]